jgi:hypothetical protein
MQLPQPLRQPHIVRQTPHLTKQPHPVRQYCYAKQSEPVRQADLMKLPQVVNSPLFR